MMSPFRPVVIGLSLLASHLASFVYGVLVGFRGYPPFKVLRANYESLIDNNDYERIPDIARQTDLEQLNSVQTAENVAQVRSELIEFIWNRPDLPTTAMPDSVTEDVTDSRFTSLEALDRVDKLTLEMKHGVDSKMYLFHPEAPRDELVIYHHGHGGGFVHESDTIQHFLRRGYSVLGMSMPLEGENSTPVVETSDFGTLEISKHHYFRYLEDDDFCPIKYFVHPVAVALNYAEAEFDYSLNAMVGLSGGGWTAHLYAAIDPRLHRTYPIDGALPLFLRVLPPNQSIGHYETGHEGLHRTSNVLEWFTMGAYGSGRAQIQIINKYAWAGGKRYQIYEDHVKERLASLGTDSFDVFVHDQRIRLASQHHEISDRALDVITADLESGGGE